MFSSLVAKITGECSSDDNSVSSRVEISSTPSSLIDALRQSLPENKKFIIFIDDISDYLEIENSKKIKEEISIIQELLLKLEVYNTNLLDAKRNLRFISLVRNDLFEYMEGSNVNKLRNDSLELEWSEDSFASLLIRRLPFFEDKIDESLKNPKQSLRNLFPDDIFADVLKDFSTNRYATNFYAYMVAVSFNRPREFLKFCYAMRNRLSTKHSATYENIESAEIEYSDYFTRELRDELFLVSKVLNFQADQEKIDLLITILGKKDSLNTSELRTDLAQYLGEKTSWGKNKIEALISELWWYGVLGFKEDKNQLINFRYIGNHSVFILNKIKDYKFFLHRGLWWFLQKRKKKI